MQTEDLVVVNIKCGLGNQLFQYATGKALSLRKGARLKIYKQEDSLGVGVYQLDNFAISCELASETEVDEIKSFAKQKLPASSKLTNVFISKIKKIRFLLGISRFVRANIVKRLPDSKGVYDKRHYFREDDSADWSVGYRSDINGLELPAFIEGFFPSYKYFDDYSEEIINELRELKCELSDQADQALKKIKDSNSISIHFRRGDAVSNSEVERWYRGVVTEDYYRNCIDYISKNVVNPVYFVFSNDIAWVKKNFDFGSSEVFYMDFNKGDRGYEDLYLMSRCSHNITTGFSSFAWWGAYLNNNENKIVLRTRQACGIERYNFPDDLYPDSWVVIDS